MRTPSRASLAPTVGRCPPNASHHSLGRALARLLLICPPLREAEWRRSSGGGRVAPCGEAAHIERRSKRSRPEAMPPDECRSEGTPSLGEGPDVRGEPLFAYFFLAFEKKVSRRKGETISGHYRRNGYVHHAETGRLSGRLRKQAPQPPHYQIAGEKKGNRSCPKCLACSLHPERTTAYAYANPSR